MPGSGRQSRAASGPLGLRLKRGVLAGSAVTAVLALGGAYSADSGDRVTAFVTTVVGGLAGVALLAFFVWSSRRTQR